MTLTKYRVTRPMITLESVSCLKIHSKTQRFLYSLPLSHIKFMKEAKWEALEKTDNEMK